MGKGARIREQRRQERAGRDAEPDIRRLVEALEPIASPAQFEGLVNRRPALFGQAMLDYLQQLAHDPNIEPFVSRFKHLVERAHSDPADAWLAFREEMDEAERQGRELEPVLERAYRRLVEDWQPEPKKKGAGATRGRASRGPSSGQAARQGSAPEPAL